MLTCFGPAGVGKMTTAKRQHLLKRKTRKGSITITILICSLRNGFLTNLLEQGADQGNAVLAGLKALPGPNIAVIIRDAHLLTPEAGNALLKILRNRWSTLY